MKIGMMTTAWAHVPDLAWLAGMAEERGIESFWVGEHSHLPTPTTHAHHRDTPEFYKVVPDPYVTLAAIAQATTAMRVGTAIALPAEHKPLQLAKTVATLDQAADGRFEWGVGYGWNNLEMLNNGLDPKYRMATFREAVQACRALWENDATGFDGDHVRFTESWSYPKPVQRPGPPILLGCRRSPRAFAQLVEFCDGWLPSVWQSTGTSSTTGHSDESMDTIDADLAELRRLFEEAGRDPGSIKLTFTDVGFWNDVSVQEYHDHGRIALDVLKRLRDLGADRVIVGMPMFHRDLFEPMLDEVAQLIDIVA